MARKNRDLLRPEDATSLEEFQARKVVEQAQIRGMNSSWKTIGKIMLSSLIVIIDIFFWFTFDRETGVAKWVLLVFALLFLGLFLRIFGKIELRGAGGSKRYIQLNRLDKEWQAKAERGEIPRTTPGGPKVWKDQLEGQQAETS
jgi:hypothetical protein